MVRRHWGPSAQSHSWRIMTVWNHCPETSEGAVQQLERDYCSPEAASVNTISPLLQQPMQEGLHHLSTATESLPPPQVVFRLHTETSIWALVQLETRALALPMECLKKAKKALVLITAHLSPLLFVHTFARRMNLCSSIWGCTSQCV